VVPAFYIGWGVGGRAQRRWAAKTPADTIKARWRPWCAAVSGRGRGGDNARVSVAHSRAASEALRRRGGGEEASGCGGGRRPGGRARTIGAGGGGRWP
jgi:hypothetical protein